MVHAHTRHACQREVELGHCEAEAARKRQHKASETSVHVQADARGCAHAGNALDIIDDAMGKGVGGREHHGSAA